MRLWLDSTIPSPDGYVWCMNIEEVIYLIQLYEERATAFRNYAYKNFINGKYDKSHYDSINAEYITIKEIVVTKQSNSHTQLLNWLNETGRNYPIYSLQA